MRKVLCCLALMLTCFIIVGCGDNKSSDTNNIKQNSQSATTTTKSEPAEPTWNKSEVDATKNGNLQIAVKEMMKHQNLSDIAIQADPIAVYRSPWDYYGKVVTFTGTAYVLENMPPENNMSKLFGGSMCEVIISYDGGEIVDGLLAGDTNNLQVGQTVTFYGYPIGRTEVPNKMGGKFNHLMVIGRLN